jgi:ABC-type antimicrobial peptide transport system permease subunit
VQKQILTGTLRLAVAGVVLGLAASLVLTRLIATLLYDTSPWDGATYAAIAVVLLLVAGLSGLLPARRAARIQPMVALRSN